MSLPPPGLPPEVGVRTRYKAVSAELADQQDATLQAALLFELGALTELRMGDTAKALELYRDAELRDPSFRPALFARARLLSESHHYEALLPVLAKLSQASIAASDRAAMLVELGCLLDDQLGATTAAQEAFERALATDPHCHTASLMCERRLLTQNRHGETSQLLARRAAQIQDPSLRSALSIEAAREFAATGEIDTAVETLLTALALPERQLPTLAALAELSVRHGRPWVAGRAYEDLGALLAAYGDGGASAARYAREGTDSEEIATRYGEPERAARAASYYYHRAARLQADYPNQPDHAGDALRAHERASQNATSDVHLGLALVASYRSVDALHEAQNLLRKLRQTAETDADPRRFAALSFELAELSERQGEGTIALDYLRAAHAAAPDAPSINAMLEDRLLDAGDLRGLSTLLAGRARGRGGAEQRVLLWRAALAADRALDTDRALALWSELSNACEGQERTAVLRELHGLTARAGRSSQLQSVSELLLGCALSKGERSALWRSRYEAALTERDLLAARATLHLALEEPACEEWAAHAAWLVGGLQKDHKLLALAHGKLAAAAEQSEDLQLAAAHLTAGGRALLLLDEHEAALTALRRALEIAPGQAYTRGLIERCLRMRGDSAAALGVLQEAEQLDDKHVHQAALLHQGNLAEAAGQLELARRNYDEAVALEPGSFEAQWARLRFAEREQDDTRRMSALRALTEREASHKRPGNAHLELGEALLARGDLAAAAAPLTAAIENETIAFEAAASAVLLPRSQAADALRPRALSELAEQSSRKTRRALEHERSAELLHHCPADARQLLISGAQPVDAADAFSRFLLQDGTTDRVHALDGLRVLAEAPEQQAEFRLHAARCRTLLADQSDDDALVNALELLEDAPDTLPSALALSEALDASDDPDTRVSALRAWLSQLPKDSVQDISAALARAYTDAGAAAPAMQLHEQLLQSLPNDPSLWESLRVAARMAGDYEQVVVACDVLAGHASYPTRAVLLEEAAAILHERLEQHEGAERRLRDVLSHVPNRKPAFERLHDVLVEREDLDGLLALLAKRITVTDSTSERVDLLYERASILRARNERPAALSALNELLSTAPAHPGALGLSAEIHATDENWEAAVNALRRLAATELTPAQRRLAIEGSVDFLEHNLGDIAGAYRELEKLLTLELADYAVHARMARLAEAVEWTQPAAQALTRAAALSRGPQRALLERRAAGMYMTLGEHGAAADALRRALLAHPGDEQSFTQLYTQLAAPEERELLLRDFLEQLFHALAAEPSEPDLLRTLIHAGHTGHRSQLELLGLFTLEALAQATREELSAAERLRLALPERPRHKLDDATFARLLPRTLNTEWLTLARSVSAAWLELRPDPSQQRKQGRLSARDAHPLRGMLINTLDVFGLTLGELYVSELEPKAFYPSSLTGNALSFIIGRDFQSPSRRDTQLKLLPLVAAARAQLIGLADDNAGELQRKLTLVLAAVGVLDAPLAQGEATELAAKLSRQTRASVVSAWGNIAKKDDVPSRMAQAIVNVGRRASLVWTGDLLEVANQLAEARKISLRAACVTPAGLALLRFWLSPACAELLEHLGVCP